MKKKLLTILALLLMTATGAVAQTETLLTTINNVGNTDFISGSKTFNDIATVTFSGEVGNGGDDSGWYNYTSPDEAINLTVTAVEGYTVTRVKFFCNEGSAFDEETPFEAELVMEVSGMYSNPSTKVNGISIGGYGVTKIEVYGYENPTTVNVTGVTLSETTATMTVGGDALTLTPTVAPNDATDQTVTWTTSDATVATVADGVVTAVAAGTATITATATNGTDDTSDDKTATCTVTVAQTYNVTLAEGTEDAENWTISDGTRSANGATGLSGLIGTETVTVTYDGTREVKTVKAVKKAAAATAYTLAESTVGMIVGSDGKAYAVADKDNLPSSVTAVGMVAYKSSSNGLVIALADEGSMIWDTAKSTCEGKTAIGGNSWKLPSEDEWKQMFGANGGNDASYTGLNTALATAGGDSSKLQEDNDYWSSTPSDGDRFREVYLYNGGAYFNPGYEGSPYRVRACLAFTEEQGGAAYTLLSAATAEDYGKVVCATGHLHDAKTAVPDGCTAVGILGKVTETGHGLIIALQDATLQYWTTINGWTSVTKYAGTTLKQLPDDAARGTNLTSFEKLGDTFVSNWAVAQKSDYEAIFTNLGSTAGDEDGTTYDGNVNAYITTGVGGTEIDGIYWSASVKEGTTSWAFGSVYWNGRSNNEMNDNVRPVLGF